MTSADQKVIDTVKGNMSAEEYAAFEASDFNPSFVKYRHLTPTMREDQPVHMAAMAVQMSKATLAHLHQMKAEDAERGSDTAVANVDHHIDDITSLVKQIGELAREGKEITEHRQNLNSPGYGSARYPEIMGELTYLANQVMVGNMVTFTMLAEDAGLLPRINFSAEDLKELLKMLPGLPEQAAQPN